MEQYERDMLSAEQSGPTQKIPKKEMDDIEDAYEMLDKILSNSTIMEYDTDGGLKDSLKRTRSSLVSLMRAYEKSPYLEVEKKDRIAKATLVVDPETKIRYKKWDGQGRPPINSLLEEGKGRGKDLTGWDYVVEQAGRRPGQGVLGYDSSGFKHNTMGHQPYTHKGRHFCLACQIEFRG